MFTEIAKTTALYLLKGYAMHCIVIWPHEHLCDLRKCVISWCNTWARYKCEENVTQFLRAGQLYVQHLHEGCVRNLPPPFCNYLVCIFPNYVNCVSLWIFSIKSRIAVNGWMNWCLALWPPLWTWNDKFTVRLIVRGVHSLLHTAQLHRDGRREKNG